VSYALSRTTMLVSWQVLQEEPEEVALAGDWAVSGRRRVGQRRHVVTIHRD